MAYERRPSPHLNPDELIVDENALNWPGGQGVAVVLSFELWASRATSGQRLVSTTVDFGVRRGTASVVDLLARHQVSSTFFVTATTAAASPSAVATIVDGGHEVCPLGFDLEPHWDLEPETERDLIARARDTIAEATGSVPLGWRTPYARLSLNTLEILGELGFDWDSSVRNDDLVGKFSVGGRALLEIPYGGGVDYASFAGFPAPVKLAPAVTEAYLDQLDVLADESRRWPRFTVLNFHPAYSGRPADLAMLDAILRRLTAEPDRFWVGTASEVAAWLRQHDDWFTTLDDARGRS